MKRMIYYTMSISLGLLVLMLFEGMMTLGSAFDFTHYSTFGWIAQTVVLVFTIALSAHIAGLEEHNQ
jgi:hypothetical protein